MVEYALLVALIAVALLGALQFFGDSRTNVWDRVASSLN
jgi:Flp pilus assembly pilin Flp